MFTRRETILRGSLNKYFVNYSVLNLPQNELKRRKKRKECKKPVEEREYHWRRPRHRAECEVVSQP